MLSIFVSKFIWFRTFRLASFWGIVAVSTVIVYLRFSPLALSDVIATVAQAFQGDISKVSTQSFAFALATTIIAVATGFFSAFLVLHCVFIPLSIRNAAIVIRSSKNKLEFAERYEGIHSILKTHPLLGHAWSEFDETLVRDADIVRNTLRPQTFFNYSTVREKLSGLKIMPGIPGYFVGIGLLLTFIGLVIALSKAAAGTEAAMAATGGGAQAMQGPLRELLQAATFKFSTSIAGLFASIALSFFFRLFVVGIEGSLSKFCEALETRLNYVAPQSVTLDMVNKLEAQLNELKGINGEKFVVRLAEQVGPIMQTALVDAITPLTKQIGDAVEQLSTNSQDGVQDLVRHFSDSVQGSAGTELKELGVSLNAMHGVLEKLRLDMSGSGEDFAKRMTDAAENLNRLVAEAGNNLGKQSDASRETLERMLDSLKEVFEQANRKVEENLAGAAEGASGKLEQAMDRILVQMGGQVAGLNDVFSSFKNDTAKYINETHDKVAEAQARTVAGISLASTNAAAALENGLASAMTTIHQEVETFATALRSSSRSLGTHSQAFDQISTRTREASDDFGRSSEAMRNAIGPVTKSNERLADVTKSIGESIDRSVKSLGDSQIAAIALSETLNAQIARITATWTDYERRFGKVDEDLGRAFEKLASETHKQSQLLADQTSKIDQGLAKAIDLLTPAVKEMGYGAEEIGKAVQDLKTTLQSAGRDLKLTEAVK